MEQKAMQEIEDSSGSDNEIQFIEPVSMSGTLKPRNIDSPKPIKINYENIGERIAGFISAFITICLIVGLYTTHLFFVFIPWMTAREKSGYSYNDTIGAFLWIGLGMMSFFVFMGIWSFFAALLTNNHVERPSVALKNSNDDLRNDELRIKRWCKKCNQEKPTRAHHCSICNVCVLRMDHHCPWINNCVGYRNHGHYLRFLFYVILGMLFGLILMASRLATFQGRYMYWGQSNGRFSIFLTDEMLEMTFLIADLVGCGILSLLIGLLLTVQILNVSQGHTTIESLEITQCERDIRRQRRFESNFEEVHIPFPYDLGPKTNFKAVFGSNYLLWPLPLPIEWNPLSGSLPNGEHFETRIDALMHGQWPLPTKDPLLMPKRRGSLDDGAGYIVNNINYVLATNNK